MWASIELMLINLLFSICLLVFTWMLPVGNVLSHLAWHVSLCSSHHSLLDAINIQTYAKQGDSEGCVSLRFRQISVHTHKKVVSFLPYLTCFVDQLYFQALWHLYHAKDSQTLREFLYQHQADELELAVEEVKCKLDDPIHTFVHFYQKQSRWLWSLDRLYFMWNGLRQYTNLCQCRNEENLKRKIWCNRVGSQTSWAIDSFTRPFSSPPIESRIVYSSLI